MEFKLLKEELEYVKKNVEIALDELLPGEDEFPERIHQAMRYSIFAGGKRLRPFLAYLGYKTAGGGDLKKAFNVGAALEMIHTYTLIHDDLPCMDDDDLRRGVPTCHKKFDEATAVLAGDALYARAFHVLAQYGNLDIVGLIADMSGSKGIVGGQIVDIISEGKKIDADTLIYIHNHKTAVFIKSSLLAGAMLNPDTDPKVTEALAVFGDRTGLAFQIADDILDITGNEELLGKPIGSDEGLEKATFPNLFGLEGSARKARELIDEALDAVSESGEYKELFTQLALYIIKRVK